MPKYAVVIVPIAVNALVRIATMGELEAFPAVFQIPDAAAAAIATSPPTTTHSPVQARVRCTALSLGLADRLAGCPALRAISSSLWWLRTCRPARPACRTTIA